MKCGGDASGKRGALRQVHTPVQFEFWALGLVGARPDEERRGADEGIDGELYFHDDESGDTKQILISVKSGGTGPAHVRELRGVIEREDAEIGVLMSLQEPTRKMREGAAKAGFYKSPLGTKHPRLQLITVEQLLEYGGIDYPKSAVNVSYGKTGREAKDAGQEELELDEEEG